VDRREDVRQRRIARHVRQARRGGVFVASVRESVELVEVCVSTWLIFISRRAAPRIVAATPF
jgi:hypothetical protein